jgi:aminopeptidase-like protein
MISELIGRLFPLNRSITGDGVRQTLSILNEIVPVLQVEYPTGMKCFDWEIPKEWNIKDAYVKNSKGEKLIDYRDSNLHVLGYSIPFKGIIKKAELMKHLYTIPEMPEAIPYLTSYYKERWGFCLEHKRLKDFNDDEYEVCIDSSLYEGCLTLGEGFIKGLSSNEVILSTNICHPSLAHNELSGPVVQTMIYKNLLEKKGLNYSYRFLYLPETIGSIAYLSKHGEEIKKKCVAGFVVTCVGNDASYTYKQSRIGNSLADRAAKNVLQSSGNDYKIVDWFPTGSDERQYCSIGFNLPFGSLMRSMYGAYKEYHTSLDNLDFVSVKAMEETVRTYLDIIETIEINDFYKSSHIHCEPKFDKRNLYPTLGSQRKIENSMERMLYLWAFSDGRNDIIDIAEKLNICAKDLKPELNDLIKEGLLQRLQPSVIS